MDEQGLIRKILEGDVQSFSPFVEAYQAMAYTIALRILGNREEAEEAVQDAFVKAYQALPDFRSDGKFSTWLYRIVYNTSLTALRRQPPSGSYDEKDAASVTDSEVDSALSILEREDRREIIGNVLKKMPSDEALLLTLYYLEEESVDEIHGITGLTPSNIKVKLFRGRKHFYETMKQMMKHETQNVL